MENTSKMMSAETYKDIAATIREAPLHRECQRLLEVKYPQISTLTLGSILSNYVQKLMKSNHRYHNTPGKIKEYYQSYNESVENREEPGIIIRLADSIKMCPVLVARFILEGYLREKAEADGDLILVKAKPTEGLLKQDGAATTTHMKASAWAFNRSEISQLLRFTNEIKDANLAYETYLCTIHDDQYGPFPDAIKGSAGSEHEQLLKDKLTDLNICFVDENILRQLGYDKTPDFKLEIPIAIGNTVINWIESKATFGDEETHQNYLDDQLLSYWNRYGPGLVIYWLGYVETLPLRTPRGIMISDDLPTDITIFNPNCDSDRRKPAFSMPPRPTLNHEHKEWTTEPNAVDKAIQL